MNEPKRFIIRQDGKIMAYVVRFDGWTVVQNVVDGVPQKPYVCSCMGDFLESKNLDTSFVETIDK